MTERRRPFDAEFRQGAVEPAKIEITFDPQGAQACRATITRT